MSMDFKQIQELIKLINKSNIGELQIREKDFRITLKSKDFTGKSSPLPQAAPSSSSVEPDAIAVPPSPEAALVSEQKEESPTQAEQAPPDSDKHFTIKSPMIGTFYRSSSPDKDPFVKVGDTIDVGDTVCVVEAMKLFNEIESEVTGKIVKVLVENASPVEYDQPLFLVELE